MTAEQCQIVLCPCPDREEARRIARELVEAGLAAAVNIVAQDSLFRWRGEINESSEYLLIIKSTRSSYERIEQTIMDNHSYQLPGIATVPITGGLAAYLDWIGSGGRS